ncbi:shK domain-like domain-containing protein [Ditylenchus destructor]|nr:shK domain-like domain-containing protein [Ditylenchus destructor]
MCSQRCRGCARSDENTSEESDDSDDNSDTASESEEGGCRDTGTNCARRARLCMDRRAFDTMLIDCRKTCNRCEDLCQDLGTDCPFRADKCQVPVYKDVMVWQCPRQCGWCGSGHRPKPTGTVFPTPEELSAFANPAIFALP